MIISSPTARGSIISYTYECNPYVHLPSIATNTGSTKILKCRVHKRSSASHSDIRKDFCKPNHGSFATIPDPTYHWAGCARENHCTHAAVSLISDAQWKHSSVECEIVFHVRRYSRRAVERALQDNTYSQEREQCHEIITKCRSYARLITYFLPCEVTCINRRRQCKVIRALLARIVALSSCDRIPQTPSRPP